MSFKLTFLGATQTVTGSKYLLEAGTKKYLVDCGLFQGLKDLRLRNWENFPISASEIDGVLLTHAHLDHSGYLPRLVKQGFKGKIYCTAPTEDLASILLQDSGYLQEEEAKFANKHRYSKHRPALPLYTAEDAKECLPLFSSVPFHEAQKLPGELAVTFEPVGHILGAASIRCEFEGKSITFSGDLGRIEDPIFYPPTPVKKTDYLVVESTYGARQHENVNPLNQLSSAINRVASRGGVILIPAFAVGRAQSILHYLSILKQEKKLPDIPVYLNSPMAIDATDLFCRYPKTHRLSKTDCLRMCSVAQYIRHVVESKHLNTLTDPMIIISASGMAEGGRILHHLKAFLPDSKNAVLFTGFQAAGTRGEALVHGKKEIKIHGEMVPVRAEIMNLSNLSAHADQREILTWLKHAEAAPTKTFITHGEPESAQALQAAIQSNLNWQTSIPTYKERVEL